MSISVKGYVWNRPAFSGPIIQSAVARDVTGPYRSDRIIHGLWVLDYTFNTSGCCRVGNLRSRWFSRNAHCGHLYAPWTPYWEDISSSRVRSAHITFWNGEKTIAETLVDNPLRFAQILDSRGQIGDLLVKAADIGQTYRENGFWKAQSVLSQIFDVLQRVNRLNKTTCKVVSETPAYVPRLVLEVQAFLQTRMCERVLLDEIAHAVNVSPSLLSHRYRKEAGETPIATHMRLRVEQIKKMLISGSAVKYIAAEMGFSDMYHLSKFFKRIEGVSPRQFLHPR